MAFIESQHHKGSLGENKSGCKASSPGDETKGASTGPIGNLASDCKMRELQLAGVPQVSQSNLPQEGKEECG